MFLLTILFPRKVFSAINLTISDLTQKDDYYQIAAVVTGMSSSSGTFVQGMFTPAGASKYFGFTFSKKGEWLKYESSPEKNFVLDNYMELKNDQPVTIFLKPDFQDKDYSGPGKYLIKLKRFTASGSPSDYSNSLEIDLSYVSSAPTTPPTSTPTSTITPSTTSFTSPTATKTTTLTPTPTTPPKTPTPTANLKTTVTSTAVLITSPSTIRSTTMLSPASQAGQVLATTTSVILIVTSSPSAIYNFQADLNLATPSSSVVSDKALFVIGASIFSLSGGLLYFRLKNL